MISFLVVNNSLVIAAAASGIGKTMLTLALLQYFCEHEITVQPFKIGPDFIDPQFHFAMCQTPSVNLDVFLSGFAGVQNLFLQYHKSFSLVEGVMGFYDSCDKQVSTYDVAKELSLPVILLLPAKGQSHTLLAYLKGLLEFKRDNTIAGIILNFISSSSHYQYMKNLVEAEFPQLKIYGYIEKDLKNIKEQNLGLDLTELKKDKKHWQTFNKKVLQHIDVESLKKDFFQQPRSFQSLNKRNRKDFFHEGFYQTQDSLGVYRAIVSIAKTKHLCIVYDDAFSFFYYDDFLFFKEIFKKVTLCSPLANQEIPQEADALFIAGGRIANKKTHEKLLSAKVFSLSLIDFYKSQKRIYATGEGMLLLGRELMLLDKTILKFFSLLPMDFQIENTRQRLGYYYAHVKDGNVYQGHAFHYSKETSAMEMMPCWQLSKSKKGYGQTGAWQKENVLVTFLHVHFRNNLELVFHYLL